MDVRPMVVPPRHAGLAQRQNESLRSNIIAANPCYPRSCVALRRRAPLALALSQLGQRRAQRRPGLLRLLLGDAASLLMGLP